MDLTIKLIFDKVKQFALLFIMIVLLLKIVFYEESIFSLFKVSASILWLLVIPGYCITSIWKEMALLERIIISVPASIAVIGITSYYLGLFGLNLKIQAFLLPAVILSATLIIHNLFKEQKK